MDRVGVSHQVSLIVEEFPTYGTGQFRWSVKTGVFSQSGSRGEQVATVWTLDLREFLVVSLLYVVVQSVNGGVPLRALSTCKVELCIAVVKFSFNFLVDKEHVLLHFSFVGQHFLADLTDIAAVHLQVVCQTGLGRAVNPTQMADKLRLLLYLILVDSLLDLLVYHFLQFLSASWSSSQPVVHSSFAHFETFVSSLKSSVQQKFATERTILWVDAVNIFLLSDDV